MNYTVRKREMEKAEDIAQYLPYSPLLIDFMISKGYKTREEIAKFLCFWENDLRPVRKMKDAESFITAVAEAVRSKKHITIYGDYDGDGVMGTSIAIWVFRWLGIKANYFINHRFNEGYGLNEKGMKHLMQLYPDTEFIITLDNGISAEEGIRLAESHGIQVVVSDHHQLVSGKNLPDCPVVDEWRPDEDPDARVGMCGAELIRRLLIEVIKELGMEKKLHSKLKTLIGFSGFATISDSVKLNPENHFIAKKGIEVIQSNAFPCWPAFAKAAGSGTVDETTIGYYYGPMVNASSRVTGESDLAVKLCIAEDNESALSAASVLKEINERRKKLSYEAVNSVTKQITENGWNKDPFIVATGDGKIGVGIAGLACSKICETYEVPAICLSPDPNDDSVYKGSGRSVPGVNLIEILEKCSDLFVTVGGHAEACGVQIKKENVEPLRERLRKIVKKGEPMPLAIDFDVKPSEISQEVINEFNEIAAPFGVGFEAPVWMLEGVVVPTVKRNKKNGDTYENVICMKNVHAKWTLVDEVHTDTEITCIFFNGYNSVEDLYPEEKMKVLGVPSLNVFMGTVSRQFIVNAIIER